VYRIEEKQRLRMFENRVQRETVGPKRDEVRGDWRRLHNEELNDLYCSSNVILGIKSRKMRFPGHGTRMGERKGV